jgi:hypothetical protein
LQYSLPDDYGMSVAQYLIDATLNDFGSRQELLKLMLSTKRTSFITSNVKVFIDSWAYLSENERKLVSDLLLSDRIDINWIQAVALNRESIPREVQLQILGDSIEDRDIERIVDILIEKNIIEQCLNVHCGYPQPLWWNGYHHCNYELWDAVIVEVMRRNIFNNRVFDIALREFIHILYNKNEKRIDNLYNIYITHLLSSEEKRKLAFERLLFETVTDNQSNKKGSSLFWVGPPRTATYEGGFVTHLQEV